MYLDLLLASLALLPSSVSAAGLYSKKSAVLQVDATNYDRLIAKSNYTSIVEFYAPWCGHCKNLQPAYEKAAQSLTGLAKVAAINCDEEHNKPFCGRMGVQGFPTLKIVKPSKKGKGAKAVVEDYQGARTAKAISEALTDKIPSHVTKLKDGGLDAWIGAEPQRPKTLFFTEKGVVGALVKAVAIDFLAAIDVAQVRSTEKATVEKYGVTSFPSVILLPGGPDAEPIKYDGEINKASLLAFLSQAASPNPDATPEKKEPPKAGKSSSQKVKPSASKKPAAASETLEDNSNPTESPDAQVSPDSAPPVRLPVEPAPKLPELLDEAALQKTCLHSKATMCVLAFTPQAGPEGAEASAEEGQHQQHVGLTSLSEIAHKHKQRGANIFPFYAIPSTNAAGQQLVSALRPSPIDGFTLVAVNAKRGWWANYNGNVVAREPIEAWIDAIRFGEISKTDLPEGLVQHIQEEINEQQPGADGIKLDMKVEPGMGQEQVVSGEGEGPVRVEVVELDEHDEL